MSAYVGRRVRSALGTQVASTAWLWCISFSGSKRWWEMWKRRIVLPTWVRTLACCHIPEPPCCVTGEGTGHVIFPVKGVTRLPHKENYPVIKISPLPKGLLPEWLPSQGLRHKVYTGRGLGQVESALPVSSGGSLGQWQPYSGQALAKLSPHA